MAENRNREGQEYDNPDRLKEAAEILRSLNYTSQADAVEKAAGAKSDTSTTEKPATVTPKKAAAPKGDVAMGRDGTR